MALSTNNTQTTCGSYRFTLSSADFLSFFVSSFFLLLSGLGWLNSLITKDIFCHNIWISTQKNICTTTCHVSCDGNSALSTGLSNNLRLTLMELCIQNIMLNAAL